MKLIIGLGNPGNAYAGNRHNIGFMAVDRIREDHGFTPWRKAFQGWASEGRLGGDKAILLKPDTFMNLSGQSVQAALSFYKLTAADVVVFHDELDLVPGKAKFKQGGGHAGHNGLRSIHQHLGTDAYGRVRLGIGHPGHKDAVAKYVLSDFAKGEQNWLADLMQGISQGAAFLATNDGARFSNAVALCMSPPSAPQAGSVPLQPPAEHGAQLRAKREPKPELPAAKTIKEPDVTNPLQRLKDFFS
jgi:PTH1 family peptidyl-tRNA hydrolase